MTDAQFSRTASSEAVPKQLYVTLGMGIPLAVVAEALERTFPLRNSLPAIFESAPGMGRYVYFFLMSYMSVVPLVIWRLGRVDLAVKRVTPLVQIVASLILITIAAAPLFLAALGQDSVSRIGGIYDVAVHTLAGLWLLGSIFNYVSSIAIWVIAVAFKQSNSSLGES